MKRLALILTCAVAAAAPADEEAPTAAAEVWNSGVDSYRAGDTTNALAILRPLMLSRTHGARAAEVVAKIEYDAAPNQVPPRRSSISKRLPPRRRSR